jgi:hypothetical protein
VLYDSICCSPLFLSPATQDKEAVEAAVGDELVCLLLSEGTARAQHVDEARRDAAIHVEDESLLLLGRHLLHLSRGAQQQAKQSAVASSMVSAMPGASAAIMMYSMMFFR